MLRIKDLDVKSTDFEGRLLETRSNYSQDPRVVNHSMIFLRSEYQAVSNAISTLEQTCLSDFLNNGKYSKNNVRTLNRLVHLLNKLDLLLGKRTYASRQNLMNQHRRDYSRTIMG